MEVATYFFEIVSLESRQKCCHQHISVKRRKGYFFTDFLRIHLYIQSSKDNLKDILTAWKMET